MANQISKFETVIAGISLVVLTAAAMVVLVGFWPDKLATNGKIARYEYKWFHMTLLDSLCVKSPCASLDSEANKKEKKNTDTLRKSGTDTTQKGIDKKPLGATKPPKDPNTKTTDTHAGKAVNDDKGSCTKPMFEIKDTIPFNAIIMILVAAAGFLGNMVHIATSFTTFVGSEQFKRNWILWYCVKPFTASALALIVYFAFRAGFLNSTDSGSNINIYGILSISAFVGLFTDIATQKLKEVFEVIFKPKETRPNPLEGSANPTFTTVKPELLSLDQPNNILITGGNLDKKKWTIKMNEVNIDDSLVTATASLIHFAYTITDADKTKNQVILTISSDTDKPDFTKEWGDLSKS
ncbi:MAG: hypothetical protein ACXVB0_01355 [Mucilaginibacter sp.]